jgi:hypothetical protein
MSRELHLSNELLVSAATALFTRQLKKSVAHSCPFVPDNVDNTVLMMF